MTERDKSTLKLRTEFGIPTLETKLEYHDTHRIPFDEAKRKPEFWVVTGLTLARLFVGAYAVYLAFDAAESSQLALPAILTLASWVSDYFDGSYARRHEVCTDLGKFLDHGLADLPMAINTLAIPIMMFTK